MIVASIKVHDEFDALADLAAQRDAASGAQAINDQGGQR